MYQTFDDVYPKKWLAALRSSGLDIEDQVLHLLTDQSDVHEATRKRICELLEFGHAHGFMDKSLLGRVRSTDYYSQFAPAYAELLVARLLHDSGLDLDIRPQTRRGEGEFIARKNGPDIWIDQIWFEVKSIAPGTGMREADITYARMTLCVDELTQKKTTSSPLIVVFNNWKPNTAFRIKPFKDWLRVRLFSDHIQTFTREEKYVGTDGFTVEVSFIARDKACYTATTGTFPQIREAIDKRVRHKLSQAHFQRPSTPASYVVVLVDFAFPPINHYVMSNALFGTLGSTWQMGDPTSSQTVRESNGFLSRNQNQSLSAIGWIRFPNNFSLEGIKMAMYHNPWAKKPLPMNLMNITKISHFVQGPGDNAIFHQVILNSKVSPMFRPGK